MSRKYFAFISYKRADEEWAKWFQNELENYHLPSSLNGREDLPSTFRPVFRDIDELKAGNLPKQISNALADSVNLVVICSSRLGNDSAAKWVNKEISNFLEIRSRESGIEKALNHVFPFIVDGIPHAADPKEECFPRVLRELSDNDEIMGGNINEGGRERAFVKVLAGMLPGVAFDDLWNKYERDKIEKERRERMQLNRLLLMQSRYISEKAIGCVNDGDSYLAVRMLLNVLPANLEEPERPFSFEAEQALYKAAEKNNAILRGHEKAVNSIAVSPDGKYLISGSEDNTVKIWDIKSGRCMKSVDGCGGTVTAVGFTPDGKYYAYGTGKDRGSDAVVIIRDIRTDEIFRTVDWSGLGAGIYFSCDGRILVTASWRELEIFDVGGCRRLCYYKGGMDTGENIRSLQCTPDCGFIATNRTCGDGVEIWNVRDDVHMTLEDERSACFSHDGKYLITCSAYDGEIRFRNCDSMETVRSVPTHEKGFIPVMLSASRNGRYLAICGRNVIVVWKVSPDGRRINTYRADDSMINSVCFSRDSRNLYIGLTDGTIRIWDFIEQPEYRTLEFRCDELRDVCFSPDGKYMFTSSRNSVHDESYPMIMLWDLKTGRSVWEREYYCLSHASCFSGDGRSLLVSDMRENVDILNVEDGKCIRTLDGNEDECIYSISLSSDGRCLLSGGRNTLCKIRNPENGECLKEFGNPGDVVICVRFSSDGKYMATLTQEYKLSLWDKDNPDEAKIITDGNRHVDSLCFSPDGKYVVWCEGHSIKLWDIENGEMFRTIEFDTDAICSVGFSPDGKYIVSGGRSHFLRIVHVETGILISEYRMTDPVIFAGFTPDYRNVVAASDHGQFSIIPFTPIGKLLVEFRKRFKNNPLTAEERHKYYLDM